MTMTKSRLPHPITYRHCNARLFHHESRDTCFTGGKISFSRVNAPIELQQLFLDDSAEGKHFRQHIRSYNHVLSFTSIGVHVDENILASDRGIYTFSAQGAFYHNIGDSMEYGRDINVIRHDGNLKKVQDTKGYYDPLQYPILFPFGTHGWDINTTNRNGRRVSYRAYYSYMLQVNID
ncbi:hypothetical protein KIW84_034118 [Lathyrus oleraceus]|uniref:Uncharacterized protein n=1 Tax=Pisum sativum TaxID=3888 RepID=A0A9D5B4R6_PEA|nr:hypothetical protein KIW84_034118 [Pisum sativum]